MRSLAAIMTTPENAAEYLSRINWKSLVEWLTAEAILSRPHDPVTFCRDLLSQQIQSRRGTTPWNLCQFADEQQMPTQEDFKHNT